jgi:hypothetical protein
LVDLPVDTVTSTLTLRESLASSSFDPTTFTLSTGTVYLKQGTTGILQPLSSNRVTVSNLLFTRHYNLNSTSSPFGTDSVSYSFTVNASTSNQAQYSQLFQSSASVLVPVPKITLVQQTKLENNTASVASTVKAFATNNESGDLLLALVANKGLVTSTISDTNGNTWTLLESSTFPSFSEVLTLYGALNVNAGADTTTVKFASGASYASMDLYEYRGASTVSSFDAWGIQTQASTSAPTSGLVSPTSTVELLFGADYNAAPTSSLATPGAGYTLETSSTVGNNTQLFVEDQDQYITGSVASTWQYGVYTSSTALIATFK